jgi:AcrR family transcriptional regulator
MTKRTAKAERTRDEIRRAALASFAEHGYRATTLRDIAARTDTSVGLAYRYFPSKEAIVLSLYAEIAEVVERASADLPAGTMGARFASLLETKIALLAPQKEAFAALVGPSLDPSSTVKVTGNASADIRTRMVCAFRRVVDEARDAPAPDQREDVIPLLYALHLLVLLVWIHDEAPRAARTREALAMIRGALDASSAFVALPPARSVLERLGALVRSLALRETEERSAGVDGIAVARKREHGAIELRVDAYVVGPQGPRGPQLPDVSTPITVNASFLFHTSLDVSSRW